MVELADAGEQGGDISLVAGNDDPLPGKSHDAYPHVYCRQLGVAQTSPRCRARDAMTALRRRTPGRAR
jgi:hypothetical protein